MHPGQGIRSIRRKLNVPQNELARKCGISQTSLSLIETGVKRPGKKTMGKICEVFDIPESIIYIMAMQETDVTPAKADMYRLLYPSMVSLALQIITPGSVETVSAVHKVFTQPVYPQVSLKAS
jgi:transcriptional regulator with XRE-family HTH domain